MNRFERAAITVQAVNSAASGRRSTPVSTGVFVSVPDTKEHEDLARRVAELEALFGRFSTRLAVVEQKCERMSSCCPTCKAPLLSCLAPSEYLEIAWNTE